MNNDEMLIVIKDLFEKKIDEVKIHFSVITEKLDSNIKIIAEGHDSLNEKIDNLSMEVGMLSSRVDKLDSRVDKLDSRVDKLDSRIDKLESTVDKLESRMEIMNTNLNTVKDYVINVDKKLNEHDVILKRVK